MSTAGPNVAGTGANDSSNGQPTAWSSPSNVTANDGSYASIATLNPSTQYIKATNFSFTIPSGTAIDGITVTINRYCNSGSGTVNDTAVRIVKGGSISTTNLSAGAAWTIGSSPVDDTFGGTSNLWGESFTYSDINASNFGVVMSAAGSSLCTPSINYIAITVSYHILDSTATYNETMSGGVVGGGAALLALAYIMQGGAVCAGVATHTMVINQSTNKSGVLCSGTLNTVYNESTSGGVVAGSSAIQTQIYNPSISSYGVLCGGNAIDTQDKYYYGSGGMVLSGFPYQYKTILTIPANATLSDLSGFPAVFSVDLDPTHIADGTDYTVTDTNSRELAHQLRRYDAGRLVFVAKVDIDHTTDCVVWLYYGG